VSRKPLLRRRQARLDLEEAVDHYRAEAGAGVAARFIEAARKGLNAVRDRPSTGSPKFGYDLHLGNMRSRRIVGFPYLIFYTERDSHVEVWRVLHERADIAALFGASND